MSNEQPGHVLISIVTSVSIEGTLDVAIGVDDRSVAVANAHDASIRDGYR